jgi:hypothetical protein
VKKGESEKQYWVTLRTLTLGVVFRSSNKVKFIHYTDKLNGKQGPSVRTTEM